MTDHASPLSPSCNAIVMASAGTGKTWQLVTRLLRLLLDGAAPDAILAITFTRKAAMEMETRLLQRLYLLAGAGDEELVQFLREAGATVDEQTFQRARRLHEELLRAARPLRTTTFHAFCQELLRRFPLEADVPPGFELLESHCEVAEAAWQTLLNEVTLAPASSLAMQLEQLLELCGSLSSLRSALFGFLDHRSDWWAFIEDEEDGSAFASARLREQLGVDPDGDPLHDLFDAALDVQLGEYVTLMAHHPGVENARQLTQLSLARDDTLPNEQRFEALQSALLTKEGNPRSRKPSKAQAKSMGGEMQEAHFLELATLLCGRTLNVRQQLAALDSWHFNTLWYQIGSHLLAIFQRIKQEQRLLDFTDLEWRSYRLLTQGENAHWIQYKLDQRIDHLLVDEFQDTNPTQWRMLLPLLQEMAAGASERRRSVFLVGDAKQSIYRFRRAEPRLFPAAQAWLTSQMQADTFPMHSSRRSSPAIMACVNQLFSLPQLHGVLHDFTPHTTYLDELWGKVVVLPQPAPAQEVEAPPSSTGMRNPLLQPRVMPDDDGTLQEARQIASEIRQLVESTTLIGSGNTIRPLHYGDIMLLLRTRTRVRLFEKALREAAIPFIGADRGTLLESMEVRDMIALLQTLLTPFDNLALATVLRSPLGGCSNDDLLALAPDSRGSWWERLTHSPQPTTPLQRMAALLMRWHSSAGQLPIHDLLDRIYSEGNVLERYEAAYPEHLRLRVRANLIRFLELALEMDSGRYPSLNHFLARLEQLRDNQHDAPDETPSSSGQRVRIMTIHASKGLESPVVFLADTGNSETRDRSTFSPMVRWPVEQPRPDCFLLAGRKAERDAETAQLIETEREALQKESINLLYVAVTRARQLLYISGTPSRRTTESDNWYELLRKALDPEAATPPDLPAVLELGSKPGAATISSPARVEMFHEIPAALGQPLTSATGQPEIAPSRAAGRDWLAVEEGDEDGRVRGIAIHRFLQLLACRDNGDTPSLLQSVAAELAMPPSDQLLHEWLAEAQRVVKHDSFHPLFAPAKPAQSYCELPLLYRNAEGATVHGVIDRLIVSPTEVLLIDYKTHRSANSDTIPTLAESYREQLRHYMEGLHLLWPDRKIRPLLLFTAPLTLHELTLQ